LPRATEFAAGYGQSRRLVQVESDVRVILEIGGGQVGGDGKLIMNFVHAA
jgi:hypothetical protein